MARFSYNETYNLVRNAVTCNFTSAGSSSWTVPSGVTCVTFELWGGGGGGGAKCCCDCYHMSTGGGAGAYVGMTMPVTPGDSYTLCIGYGGYQTSVGDVAHWSCFGGDASTTYITGNGITKLCADGGRGSHNNCYSYCMCTECGSYSTATSCALSSGSDVSCALGNCYACGQSSTRRTNAYTNVWSDSQSQYYSAVVGGTSFSSNELFVNESCYLCRPACRSSRHAGNGGQGAINASQCCCYHGFVGRPGKIIIRY